MTLEIEVKSLNVRYGRTTAVEDVTFKLLGGKIYGLLGRNGSGKTSLLSVLASSGCSRKAKLESMGKRRSKTRIL